MQRKILRTIILAGLLLATGGSARAEEPIPTLDPVVSDVLRMLEGGVDSALIRDWLTSGEHRPGPLSADDLIALSQAEAPEELIRLLLDLSHQPPAAPVPEAVPAPPAARAPMPSPVRPAAAVGAGPDDGLVKTRFEVDYAPSWGEDEEAWDLYVYLDGEVLAWLPGRGKSVLGTEDTLFQRKLAAGRHALRLLQERHTRRGDDWYHEARLHPQALTLEVPAGSEDLEVRLGFRQARFNPFAKPLKITLDVLRDGDVLVTGALEGEAPEDAWPPLCDDLEANIAPGEKPPRPLRPLLRNCQRWASLWGDEAPGRGAVRQELERFEYRPVPINAR